jgi:hypothetical protein
MARMFQPSLWDAFAFLLEPAAKAAGYFQAPRCGGKQSFEIRRTTNCVRDNSLRRLILILIFDLRGQMKSLQDKTKIHCAN